MPRFRLALAMMAGFKTGETTAEMAVAMIAVMIGVMTVSLAVMIDVVGGGLREGADVDVGVAAPRLGSTSPIKSATRRAMLLKTAGGRLMMMILPPTVTKR